MSQTSSRIELVEQLRGIAALSVAWFHLTNQYGDWVSSSGQFGWLGVEAFFVISGFVIPLSLAREWEKFGVRAVPTFLCRRLVRIEPPYVISILLVISLNALATHVPLFQGQVKTIPIAQFLWHLAYLIPFTHYEWLQIVYWTLAFEFLFYVTVAVGFPILVSRRTRLLSLAYAGFLGAIAGGIASPLLGLFGMGMLVFRARDQMDRMSWTVIAILMTAAAMLLSGAAAQAAAGLGTAGILLVKTWSRGMPKLAGRALNTLGKISFSVYLLHVPIGGKIVNLGQRWLTSPTEHFVLSLVALAGSLLAATVYWRLIEVPCLLAARAIRTRQRPDAPETAMI